MCEILNTFFVPYLRTKMLINCQNRNVFFLDDDSNKLCNFFVITKDKVYSKLGQLKENKAPKPDRLSPKLLKEIKMEISEPLCSIFNISLQDSSVPEDCKIANVTPIFEKGSKLSTGNERPVSLISQVGKIMESCLKDIIIEYRNKYRLIKDSQHCFTSKRGCLTNLLVFLEAVTDNIDKGYPVDALYLDFQKAFDKVLHCRLIARLKALGIDGKRVS